MGERVEMQTTWDIKLWCNLCGSNIGDVMGVVSTTTPRDKGDLTLRHVREQMSAHEHAKHQGV